MTDDFRDKRIAVVGMARSGLAAAEVLASRGARVSLYDGKPASQLEDALEFAAQRGIPAFTECERVQDVDIVVTSPGVPRSAPVLQSAVRDGLPIWGEIEAAYRIARAPILAITGTNGKTTTTALLGAIVRRAGYRAFVAGNIAAGPISMALIRAADQAAADDMIVAEISSFQLEWIDQFRPKVAAILNITDDHADRQTPQEYLAAKWRIVENQGSDDTSVLRSDVPRPSPPPAMAANVVYFDRITRPDWLSGIRLLGEHSRENVMAAFAMATAVGIDEETVKNTALEFSGVVHRLEYVTTVGRVRWYNNSMCTNNDAFARSLSAIEGEKVVIAGGVFKGADYDDFGRAAADPKVRAIVFFGKSANVLGDSARRAGARQVEVVGALSDAVQRAHALAQPEDTVVLSPACASFDQFRDFEDRGDQFKSLVRGLA